MKLSAIVLLVLLLCTPLVAENVGSVCVLPNPSGPPLRISPGGNYNPATLMVKIDKEEARPWPRQGSILIDGLNIGIQHRIVLYSDNKPIQSFWFRFSQYATDHLQVSFDGYQGVQIHSRKTSQPCVTKEKQ